MSTPKSSKKTKTKPKTPAAAPPAKVSKMGRPTSYDPSYTKQAYHLALLGATDADLARAFDVHQSTIDNWKKAHPEFIGSLKRGRDEADATVAKSLYRRALGYSHPAVKIVADAKTGASTQVPYVERYAPDTTAGIFWLKNRRPDLWRDKHEIAFADVKAMTDEELEAKRKALGLG